MEWIKDILQQYTGEDGILNLDGAIEEVKKEFPKQAVVKSQYNAKAQEAIQTKKELDDLRAETASMTELQEKLTAAEKELHQVKTTTQLDAALRTAGAADDDLDYLRFKLGTVELEEDGTIKDLENKVKELAEKHNKFFPATDAGEDAGQDDETPPGYKVLDNSLEQGKKPDPEAVLLAEVERAMGLTPPQQQNE